MPSLALDCFSTALPTEINNDKTTRIIGGGILGTCLAVKLSKLGKNVTLYEKNNSIMSATPWCHIHTGGFLYPEISLQDALQIYIDGMLFRNEFKDSGAVIKTPTEITYLVQPKELQSKIKVLNLIHSFLSDTPLARQLNNNKLFVWEYLIDQNKLREHLMSKIHFKVEFNTTVNNNVTQSDVSINCTGAEYDGHFERKCHFVAKVKEQLLDKEIAIIGKRNTDSGMLQLTPINNTIIVHKMTQFGSIVHGEDNVKQREEYFLKCLKEYLPDVNIISSHVEFGNQRIRKNDNHFKQDRSSQIYDRENIILMKATSVVRIVDDYIQKYYTKCG